MRINPISGLAIIVYVAIILIIVVDMREQSDMKPLYKVMWP